MELGETTADRRCDLSQLSRMLALSSMQREESPEEYIRKTLRAHGFFSRAQPAAGQSANAVLMNGGISPDGGPDKSAGKSTGITEEDRRRTTQLIYHRSRHGREFHTLKEPRSLFAHSMGGGGGRGGRGLGRLPLWPLEVDSLPPPSFPPSPPHTAHPSQPFHHADRDIVSPKIRSSEGLGTVVYTNHPGPEKYFTTARAGPSLAETTPTFTGTTLEFESRFESGNLAKAVQVGRWDYELYLRYDLYTSKHTQWFYFRVRNMRPGQTYRFTIVNLYKAGSLYNAGMQPVVYSQQEATQCGTGWHRGGHSICYFKTPVRRVDTRREVYCYGVSWSYSTSHSNDTCYFAHCFPYTYSDLQNYLQAIQADPEKARFCKQRTLCHSIAGNPVPLLTITSPVKRPSEAAERRAVVLTARVHPGETNGSWMMKGLLDFLTGSSPDAKILRESFVFKVIPMLNPDGVVVGNYRCSLAGRDLNRNYRSSLKDSYPTVWHAKSMVKRLVEEREVVLYCDMHGHSKKQNVFIYGCDVISDPLTRLKARVFPRMLSKNTPAMFSYRDSRFGVQKSKEGTGRVVMWREMGITNSYTMEATFCGSSLGSKKGLQFSTADLEAMGVHFCDTLLDYCDPDQSKVDSIMHELEEEYRATILARLASLGRPVPPPGVDPLDLSDVSQLLSGDDSDGGSDSSASDGPPVNMSFKKKRKKKLKSRRERNKKKAMLKMSHAKDIPPPPLQATGNPPSIQTGDRHPANSDQTKSLVRKTAPAESSTPYRHMVPEVCRNGGIPIFVQERLEERHRRRGNAGSVERLSDELDYMEALALEYLQQALPNEQGPPPSTHVLPQPSTGCLMSISSKPLCESRSALSRPSLSHLDPTTGGQGGSGLPNIGTQGAFASQYVARHMQDIVGEPSSTKVLGNEPNNTKNLANLSRLFRQLRPQVMNSRELTRPTGPPCNPAPHHHHQQQQQQQQQQQAEGDVADTLLSLAGQEETRDGILKQTSSSRRDVYSHSKDGGQFGVGIAYEDGCRVSLSDKTSHAEDEAKQCDVQLQRQEAPPINEPIGSMSPSQMPKFPVKQPPPSSPKIASYERRTIPDLHNTMLSNLPASLLGASGGKTSPLTNSWESFTRPVTLAERGRDEAGGDGARVCELEEKVVQCEGGEAISQPLYDTRLYDPEHNKIRKKLPASISKSRSAPDQSCSSSPHNRDKPQSKSSSKEDAPVVKTHRRREILQSTAAPGKHSHKQKRRTLKDPPESSQQKAVSHSFSDHYGLPGRPNKAGTLTPFTAPHKPPSTFHPSPPSHITGPHEEQLVASINERVPPSPHPLHESVCEDYIAMTGRVVSSKPPSRYGPRPKPQDGVTPATVSLMLSGRRSHTPYTAHRPRPLHIRYFTKKNSSSFFLE